VALENGRANERRIAARGKMRGPELREQRCRPKQMQRLRYHRSRAGNSPRASFEAAAHRVLAFRTTGVLSYIRVRNGGGLAIRRHQGRDSRECDHRSLQADSEHHNESDELTLHNKNISTRPAFAQPKSCLPRVPRLRRARDGISYTADDGPVALNTNFVPT
jgi:hypothetical protein